MNGRYYLKHTINHTIDNNSRIKEADEKFKLKLKQDALQYLRSTDESQEEKIKYLRNLTQGVYRYGKKYSYPCNLSSVEIDTLIRQLGDDELYRAYFGKTIEEIDNNKNVFFIWSAVIIVVVFLLL